LNAHSQRAFELPFPLVGGRAEGADEPLVARLRAGRPEALAEAYDAHHAHVRAFARRLVGDDATAEDLVQETFLALPKAATRFRGESSLRTLLVSIAIHHAQHHVRAASRRRAATARLANEPAGSGTPSPADDVARRQLAAALMRALDTLPIDQRVAIVLCEVEERTSAEVARLVGAPEATVRTRVFHAKKKLVEALAREGIR
jgi:RNA polymerase sigma-70 factor (ECF subfamily)